MVKPTFMCDWANCTEDAKRVSITTKYATGGVDQRKRFCCFDHAVRWLTEETKRQGKGA